GPRGPWVSERRCDRHEDGHDNEGHCGLPVETLVELATKLLQVNRSIASSALDHELAHEEVVADAIGGGPWFSLRGLYVCEPGVAEHLLTSGGGQTGSVAPKPMG